jgi:prophage regulatory protein
MVPKLLRRHQLEANLGISRSTIYQMMASGEFPKPLRIGRRAVGWRVEDIEKWLEEMQEQSNG